MRRSRPRSCTSTRGRPMGDEYPVRVPTCQPKSILIRALRHTLATMTGVYEIPQEHRDFLDGIRQVVAGRVAPRAAEVDRTSEYPWDVREALSEADILALPFEEEHGGTGTGTLMLQMAVEEIAKASASCALILMVQELGTLPIQLFGSDELKARLLPRCATGEWSPAFALSEP